jgi:N-acetylglutamate synthase-like GNAT family acetyltransferase
VTTVRRFQPGDHDAVIALVLDAQQREFGIEITYEDQPDLQDPVGFFDGRFWVAVAGDGTVVGCVGLLDVGEGTGVVRKMFVDPARRGAGDAQALLATLVDAARADGMLELLLGTTSAYHAAHRFYEKSGFVRVEPDHLPERFPRVPVDSRFYRMALDAP